MFVWMISSEPQNILLPNLVWWWSKNKPECYAERKKKKNSLLSSRSRSQRGLILSNSDSDYYIFWTADSLPTRLGLMIGYHRPEHLVEKIGLIFFYCQGHNGGPKCQCLSRCYLLNFLTFCCLTWYCDVSLWAGVLFKMICLLFSRSRSQQEFVWSKYVSFYHIFWIANSFAKKTWFDTILSYARVSYQR